MSPSEAATFASSLSTLRAELDTAWAPDPWAFRGLPDVILADTQVQRLTVPFVAGRIREVPVLGHGLHQQLDSASHRVATELDHLLPETVCGYRPTAGGGWKHYRQELRRRFELEDTLARDHRIAARIDIQRFFPSIGTGTIRRVLGGSGYHGDSDVILQGLDLITSRTGYPIPEGYAFARALANLVLSHVDQRLDRTPFVRWLDDYTIFGDSTVALERSIADIERFASEIGLRVNRTKTEIVDSSQLKTSRSGSLVELHPERNEETLSTKSTERQLRYSLRLAAENNDGKHLMFLADHFDVIPDSVYPRLAWYLSAVPSSPITLGIVHKALSRPAADRQAWAILRLAPVLWYLPEPISDELAELLIKQSARESILIPVVARVLARHAPGGLDLLSSGCSAPRTERALALAASEANTSTSDSDFSAGPPVKSYL